MPKIIQSFDVNDYEILSDDGWKDLQEVHMTKPYEIWLVVTRRGFILEAADEHIVFTASGKEIYVKDLAIGTLIQVNATDFVDEVVEVGNTGVMSNMYDVTVEGEKYYVNDILSHNTTTTVGYLLHAILFKEYQYVGILANKLEGATGILKTLKTTYSNLPLFLQQGVVKWNDGDIELGNGSVVIASATTKDAARGKSFTHVFLDEFAFVPDNVASEFFTAILPTISAGKNQKMFIVSTPNGMNLFYKLWVQATNADPKKRSFFTPFEVLWNEVPGRNEHFKTEMLKSITESDWRQEYACVSGDTLLEMSDNGEPVTVEIKSLYAGS